MRLRKYLSFLAIVLAIPLLSHGQTLEPYSSRPDILSSQIPTHESYSAANVWSNLRDAHFAFVAELLAMNPSHHIYFLARDAELLYDTARLVTEGTADQDRIHLLNVSRANMSDLHLVDYLADNGISESDLLRGKQVLLVDTGFAGTIPQRISGHFSQNAARNISTQLIVSRNPQHPSSRVFLSFLTGSVFKISPSNMHGTIIAYEHMPRFSYRSENYQKINGHWEAMSPIFGDQNDGSVSKKEALSYMAELKTHWAQNSTRSKYFELKSAYSELLTTISTSRTDLEIHDSVQSLSRGDVNLELQLKAFAADVNEKTRGVNPVLNIFVKSYISSTNSIPRQPPSKLDIIASNPNWAKYLDDPVNGIKKLVMKKDWPILGAILDYKLDYELKDIVQKNLFKKGEADDAQKELQKVFVANQVGPADNSAFSDHLISLGDKQISLMLDFYLEWVKTIESQHLLSLEKIFFPSMNADPAQIEKRHHILKVLKTTEERAKLVTILSTAFGRAHDPHTTSYTYAHHFFSHPESATLKEFVYYFCSHASNPFYIFRYQHFAGDVQVLRVAIEHYRSSADSNIEPYMLNALSTVPDPETREILRKSVTLSPSLRKSFLDSHLNKTSVKSASVNVLNKSEESSDVSPKVQVSPKTDPFLDFLKSSAKPGLKTFPAQKAPAPKTPAPKANSVKVAQITSSLEVNEKVEIGGQIYRVTKILGEGRRGVVFKIVNKANLTYALKVVKEESDLYYQSLKKESRRMEEVETAGLRFSKILGQGKNYLLKEYIEGISGKDVFSEFNNGNSKMKKPVSELLRLVADLRSRGVYIGDFRPENLIWTGVHWVVVDSGSVQFGLSMEQSQIKWSEKFSERWQHQLPPQKSVMCKFLFATN